MVNLRRFWAVCMKMLVFGLFAFVPGCSAEAGSGEEAFEGEESDPVASLSQAVTSQTINSAWQCAVNVTCQDIFDFDMPANTSVTISVGNITGNSVLRLSVFGPGQPLNGVNMLTGSQTERRCSTVQNQGTEANVRAVVAGRYRVAVVRDFGASSGASGNYSLSVQADKSFTYVGQTANNQASQLTQAPVCQFAQTQNGSWSCGTNSCADVYEFYMPAGARVSLAMSNITGSSVPRLGLFGPDTFSTNLLTGLTLDRECVGQNANDSVSFIIRTAGLYRWAIGRDFGSSGGSSGTYRAVFNSPQPLTFTSQPTNDGITTVGTQCGYTFVRNSSWSCGLGVNCQDVFDFDANGASPITIQVTSVTGSSVTRMALFDGGALNGVNKLNGASRDRKCVGQNATDTVTVSNLTSLFQHRLAIGRDAASSEGTTGNYQLRVTTTNAPMGFLGQTVNNGASAFTSTSCP